MGRHATVAATSPMTKIVENDALITDDDAMSNALSTGEGEEESFLVSSLIFSVISSLIFSLLSSDASFLNLYLKRGSTISTVRNQCRAVVLKPKPQCNNLVSYSPLHIRLTVEVVRWILVRHDAVSGGLGAKANPLSKLRKRYRAGWSVDYGCGHDHKGQASFSEEARGYAERNIMLFYRTLRRTTPGGRGEAFCS